jgi:hypothetical protein
MFTGRAESEHSKFSDTEQELEKDEILKGDDDKLMMMIIIIIIIIGSLGC